MVEKQIEKTWHIPRRLGLYRICKGLVPNIILIPIIDYCLHYFYFFYYFFFFWGGGGSCNNECSMLGYVQGLPFCGNSDVRFWGVKGFWMNFGVSGLLISMMGPHYTPVSLFPLGSRLTKVT